MTELGYEIPRKTGYLMVELALQDGLGTVYRFTDYTSDVQDQDGNTYTSLPTLSVILPPSTGTLDKTPAQITAAPLSASAVFARAVSFEAWVEVEVTIREAMASFVSDFGGAGPYTFEATLFKGRLTKAVANPGGQEDAIRLEVVPIKGRMDVELGIVAGPTCPWTFRQSPCGAEALAATQEVNVTVASIDGLVLTVSVAPTPGSPVSGDIYRNGCLFNAADGVEIAIESWSSSAGTVFKLRKPPPASWVSASILAKPGCPKASADCTRWNQTANFGGSMIAAPNWHPVNEAP